jgi:hypothetical protein
MYSLIAEDGGGVPSTVLRGFYLRTDWLWRANMPKAAAILQGLHRAGLKQRALSVR